MNESDRIEHSVALNLTYIHVIHVMRKKRYFTILFKQMQVRGARSIVVREFYFDHKHQ